MRRTSTTRGCSRGFVAPLLALVLVGSAVFRCSSGPIRGPTSVATAAELCLAALLLLQSTRSVALVLLTFTHVSLLAVASFVQSLEIALLLPGTVPVANLAGDGAPWFASWIVSLIVLVKARTESRAGS